MTKSGVIKESIRRFNHLPNRTIAKYILETRGDLFNNDLEQIRGQIRYWRGQNGDANRGKASDKSLFLDRDKIQLPKTWNRPSEPYKLPPGLWLILSDAHFPFHEPKPLEAAVQAGQAEKVNGVFINGDWQDCAAVSYWPTARRDFNKEIGEVIDSLDWIRGEFPDAMIVYKPGNHEYRLPRNYVSKMPELAESPLSAMETVIGFEERKIDFLGYFQLVMAGDLPILHGHELRNMSSVVNPARGLFLRTKSWAACSHCHTTSMHTTTNIRDETITTWSFGCLCNLHPEYNPFGSDWSWGFALVNVEKDGNFEVINRRVLNNGKVV